MTSSIVKRRNAQRWREHAPSGVTERKTSRRRIALTGVRSFLGRRLLHLLRKDRRYGKIILLDVARPEERSRKCVFYAVDLTQPGIDQTITDILAAEGVDAVAHLAFPSTPRRDERVSHELTVIGTLNILKACARAPIHKLVVRSTTLVYGADYRNPSLLDENYPLNGARADGFIRDQVEVERMVNKLASNHPDKTVTALRFCPILSHHHTDVITRFLNRSTIVTPFGYDPLIQFIHPDDALMALKKALDEDYHGAFNIVGRGVLYLSTVLWLTNKRAVPLLSSLAYPLADALWYLNAWEAPGRHLDFLRYSCVADGEKAERVMGFSPRYSTKEALLAYLKNEI
ncbi:MAG: NAD-dependent epimerase/dehydratase family protein [Acidobacteria bacterium]|nr:MAG: NAD-dependent epimerase/dehydratase family protein [Acidobacteriota bacterium]